MKKYIVGIIDEDQEDIEYIKRTIFINKPDDIKDENIEFIDYSLDNESPTELTDSLVKAVISDIIDGKIQLLIVDYKIIVNTDNIEGTEIFKQINNIVPKFPIIVLSNLTDDCYQKEFVDADKIYSKNEFFKIEEKYSMEKTNNIFFNIKNYVSQREKLTAELNVELAKLTQFGTTEEIVQSIISLENSLDKLVPQDKTETEKALDISELKQAVQLIEEAKKHLED